MNSARRPAANIQSSGYSPHVSIQDTSLLIDLHPDPIPLKAKNRPITNEDIHDLKIERQKLIDERTQLKSKIARLEVQSKKSAKTSNVNPALISQLDHEYKTVEHLIMQQRAQINELNMSDNAAQRQELQEEAKIIYMEKIRLSNQINQEEIALDDLRQQLDYLEHSDGSEVFNRQQKRIEQLETKFKKYSKENERLSARVKTLRTRKQLEEEAASGNVGNMANQLRAQIKEIEKATDEVDEKIKNSIEKHKQVMQNLKQSRNNGSEEEGSNSDSNRVNTDEENDGGESENQTENADDDIINDNMDENDNDNSDIDNNDEEDANDDGADMNENEANEIIDTALDDLDNINVDGGDDEENTDEKLDENLLDGSDEA